MMKAFARRLTVGASLLALATASLPAGPVLGTRSTMPSDPTGRGWGTAFACVGCGIGGLTLLAGGPFSVVAAASTPGSSLVLLACIAACSDAVK